MRRWRWFVDRMVVLWCRLGGTHFTEPGPLVCGDTVYDSDHWWCESCTWCDDCGRLVGREGLS